MADLINKNDISFRCSYGGECMAEIEDCKVCVNYVCDYEDVQNVAAIAEQKIRAKVIDEFCEKLSLEISESIIWDMLATMSENSSLSDTSDKIVDYVIDTSKKIAEQLKAGGVDG